MHQPKFTKLLIINKSISRFKHKSWYVQ